MASVRSLGSILLLRRRKLRTIIRACRTLAPFVIRSSPTVGLSQRNVSRAIVSLKNVRVRWVLLRSARATVSNRVIVIRSGRRVVEDEEDIIRAFGDRATARKAITGGNRRVAIVFSFPHNYRYRARYDQGEVQHVSAHRDVVFAFYEEEREAGAVRLAVNARAIAATDRGLVSMYLVSCVPGSAIMEDLMRVVGDRDRLCRPRAKAGVSQVAKRFVCGLVSGLVASL